MAVTIIVYRKDREAGGHGGSLAATLPGSDEVILRASELSGHEWSGW